LNEALPNFIDELDQRILLLSANSGGGKSVLLRQLENWAWNRYLAGESNYIPIFISYDQLENDGKIV
jgi:predicted NACHT family NTPase